MNTQLVNTYWHKKSRSEQACLSWISGLAQKERRSLIASLWEMGYTEQANELEEDFS